MNDYIKREDAINALAISQDFSGINAEKLNNLLFNIPSADVVERGLICPHIRVATVRDDNADMGMRTEITCDNERKRGEWVYKVNKGTHCSICGEGCVWDFNYCPNCGAYMRKRCANGCRWAELDGSCSNPKGLCEIEYRW